MEALQNLDHNVAGYSEDMHRRNREMKNFLFDNMYRNYRVMRMSMKAERILTELFNAYINEPSMLSRPNSSSFSISAAKNVPYVTIWPA